MFTRKTLSRNWPPFSNTTGTYSEHSDFFVRWADFEEYRLVVKNLGLDAARQVVQNKVMEIEFKPTGSTELDKPKFGKEDPNNEPHTGGNQWSGGVCVTASGSAFWLTWCFALDWRT